MYEIRTANRNVEKALRRYLNFRTDIKDKLDRLSADPRRANGAHPLRGALKGKWACWLGSNIRAIYFINDFLKQVIIGQVGTHNLY